jgi:hypothetical protein
MLINLGMYESMIAEVTGAADGVAPERQPALNPEQTQPSHVELRVNWRRYDRAPVFVEAVDIITLAESARWNRNLEGRNQAVQVDFVTSSIWNGFSIHAKD